MSNTGLKGISRIDKLQPPRHRKHGYQVYVGWAGAEARHFLADIDHDGAEHALFAAIHLRNELEIGMGKPRTELHIRASGTTPHGTWRR